MGVNCLHFFYIASSHGSSFILLGFQLFTDTLCISELVLFLLGKTIFILFNVLELVAWRQYYNCLMKCIFIKMAWVCTQANEWKQAMVCLHGQWLNAVIGNYIFVWVLWFMDGMASTQFVKNHSHICKSPTLTNLPSPVIFGTL